jgi:hypothetical protein
LKFLARAEPRGRWYCGCVDDVARLSTASIFGGVAPPHCIALPHGENWTNPEFDDLNRVRLT